MNESGTIGGDGGERRDREREMMGESGREREGQRVGERVGEL